MTVTLNKFFIGGYTLGLDYIGRTHGLDPWVLQWLQNNSLLKFTALLQKYNLYFMSLCEVVK